MAGLSKPNLKIVKKRPRFFVMLAGFAISVIIGLVAGQVGSFFYSMLGRSGGLLCISFPMQLAIVALSAFISNYAIRLLSKKSKPRS